MKNILVTGGLGFIGSHTVVEIHKQGYRPFIVDNLANSKIEILTRLKELTNSNIDFVNLDLRRWKACGKLTKRASI